MKEDELEAAMKEDALETATEANKRYAGWDDRLARLAARISVNRVIAGVHFPVDLTAGLVLGLTVGRYFIALAQGREPKKEPADPAEANLTAYQFVGETYGPRDFPWRAEDADGLAFPWADILDPEVPLPGFLARTEKLVLKLPNRSRSPLCWMWDEAVKEWQ
jgi:hypothetical protein